MIHGFMEFGLMALLAIDNSPYPPPKNGKGYLIPAMKVELVPTSGFFVGGEFSSRCDPVRANRFRPITALWDVYGGVRKGNAKFFVGHVSEHGIDKIIGATESKDYVGATYRIVF